MKDVRPFDPFVGTVLDGRYRVDSRLAAGIYRATHLSSNREVALKVLHAKQPEHVARFRREAAVLVRLRSPHIVSAFELGETPDGTLYIVMELLHGESLRGPLPWRRMLPIAKQICQSLADAHALGVIHRDLKPTNIHVDRNDFVKVLDFGIAKIMQGSDLDQDTLSRAGHMVGTFDYMAPEQIVGSQCAPQTDLFALGLVLYEMIAGERAFARSHSPIAMLQTIMKTSPTLLSAKTDAPLALDDVIAKLLARDPAHRYASATAVATALDGICV